MTKNQMQENRFKKVIFKIKNVIGEPIPQTYKREFTETVFKINTHRMFLLSIIAITIYGLLIVWDFSLWKTESYYENISYWKGKLFFHSYIVLSGVIYQFAYFLIFRKGHYSRTKKALLLFLIAFSFSGLVAATVAGFYKHQSLSSYIYGMFLFATIVILHPRESIPIYILMHISLLSILKALNFQPFSYINLYLFMIFALFVSYMLYRLRVRDFMKEKQISEHLENLKIANKKITNEANSKDKFLSILAHDLRGPIGNINVLLNEMVKEDELIDTNLLRHLRNSSGVVYDLLDSLLLWGRGQQGIAEIKPGSFQAELPVHKSIKVLELMAKQKNIAILYANEIRPRHNIQPLVYADQHMIETIIRNLLSNAIKFSRPNSEIKITSRLNGEKIEYRIQDYGVGMAQNKIDKLFKIGEANISTYGTNKEKGTGLGLILCHDFVNANKGEISVDSMPEKGTTFNFYLPSRKIKILKDSEKNIQYKDSKILIVEDDYLDLQSTSLVLNHLGIAYDTAQDGAEGVSQALKENYDIILMDIDLPRKTGVEAAKEILAEKNGASIIALSSYSELDLKRQFDMVPFAYILRKPLSKDMLLSVLNKE